MSAISAAKPKIADYPFTTLVPNLGVVSAGEHTFTVADVPGLTRDRKYGYAQVGGRRCVVVDTGGLVATTQGIEQLMAERKTLLAAAAETTRQTLIQELGLSSRWCGRIYIELHPMRLDGEPVFIRLLLR